ncbi:MAG: NAD(P)H-dependent oxidoreductase subunit E [Burkholderiaceae bacterium]
MAGALLPILHGIQERVGHIPPQAVERVARELNLSRAEVHGVITYYHFFRSEPPGRHVVQVCRAEACRAMGAEPLWQHACASLKCGADAAPGHGAKTADGRFTLEPVYCLGLCALSPAVAVDGRPHARVTPAKLDGLLARAGETAGAAL